MIRANFNFPTAYRIGAGRRVEIAQACRELGSERPLLVTDPGVRQLPFFGEIVATLEHAGIAPGAFSEVSANPTGSDVHTGAEVFRLGHHDAIIAVGGGSAMDAGKCIALVAHNERDVFEFEDVGDNWKRADPSKIAPIIALPTTAGTGSEVGRAGVVVDERDHNKKIVFHPRMLPSIVIADPELTLGLPPRLTAATGMDAFAHCFEAYCAPGYHPMADGIAIEGLRLIEDHLEHVFQHGDDIESRTHMMMAASMGATAFQKGLGLVHALSHPLGGATGLHHGTANAIFLPYVMLYNREAIEDKLDRLGWYLQLDTAGFEGVLQWVLGLLHSLQLPTDLSHVDGFDEAMAKRLAPLALHDPSLASNPKPCTVADIERVYLKAWRGDLIPD